MSGHPLSLGEAVWEQCILRPLAEEVAHHSRIERTRVIPGPKKGIMTRTVRSQDQDGGKSILTVKAPRRSPTENPRAWSSG
jgi:hypothetical protein